MSFLVLFLGILFLLLLIIKFKVNTFIALILTSVVVGLGLGMNFAQIPVSIQNGIGGSLGELAIVFGFGAMLGRLVADAGGAYRITIWTDKSRCKKITLQTLALCKRFTYNDTIAF